MVTFATPILALREDAHGPVITGGDKLLPIGRPINIQYGVDMVNVCTVRAVELNRYSMYELCNRSYVSQVAGVEVVVLVGHGENHRLLRVPRNAVALHCEGDFLHGLRGAHVIEYHRLVRDGGGSEISFDGVELDLVVRVMAPLPLSNSVGTGNVPVFDNR